MSGFPIANVSELGLTSDAVRVEPRFRFADIKADDYGPSIPAEVQFQMSDAIIRMTLVHYDFQILDICMSESMGGGAINYGVDIIQPINIAPGIDDFFQLAGNRGGIAGTNAAAGSLLGNGLPMYMSGNHLVSLTLTAPYTSNLWRFRSCYLTEKPVVYPIGTQYSKVELTWRAIPYAPIFVSGLESDVYTTMSLPYTLPLSVDTSIFIDQDVDLAEGDPGRYYLTKEILSSGICLWDRIGDTNTVNEED
jgi:hypothetical protein